MGRRIEPTKLTEKGKNLMHLFARDLENGGYFYRTFYRQAYNKLGSRELAEEKVQDLYIEASLSAENYKREIDDSMELTPGTPLVRWIRRILTHKLVDDIRRVKGRTKTQRKREFNATNVKENYQNTNPDYSGVLETASCDHTPLSLLLVKDNLDEQEETIQKLREAIGELPEDQKRIVNLRYFEGQSYREMQQQESISNATVARRLQRARRTLREKLRPAA